MLQAAAFSGGEAAPMMDDIDGVALQCWGRREEMRDESVWTEKERAVMLTDDGGRQQCSCRIRRGGGGLRRRKPVRQTRRQWRRRGAQARAWTWSGVRHQRLLQISGRAGRAEREMGGCSVLRGGRKTGEKGGPGAARQHGLRGWDSSGRRGQRQ
jgi:hypothetical protein